MTIHMLIRYRPWLTLARGIATSSHVCRQQHTGCGSFPGAKVEGRCYFANSNIYPDRRLFSTSFTLLASLKSFQVSNDGLMLNVEWTDGVKASFHGVWLRFNCRCPRCWLAVTHQKKVDPSSISPDTKINEAYLDNDTLHVKFESEKDHFGSFDLGFLRTNRYEKDYLDQKHDTTWPSYLQKQWVTEGRTMDLGVLFIPYIPLSVWSSLNLPKLYLPVISYVKGRAISVLSGVSKKFQENHSSYAIYHLATKKLVPFFYEGEIPSIQYEEITSSDKGLYKYLKQIDDFGISLLKGVPTEEKEFCRKVVQGIAPIKATLYDQTWDVKTVSDPINIANSPAGLPFHQDLIFYEGAPGIQLLHCLRFDDGVQKGETLFVDLFRVAAKFKEQYPEDFRMLTRIPVAQRRIHDTDTASADFLYHRPIIRLNHLEQIIGVHWNPFTEDPLGVRHADVIPFYRAYQRFAALIDVTDKIELRMQQGDLVTWNNRRLVHGRNEIIMTGENSVRHFVGLYLDLDDFKSKVRVLAKKCGSDPSITRTGNNSFL